MADKFNRPPLRPFQLEGIQRARAESRLLLADEMGLGKSRQAIEAFDGGNVLVLAPRFILSSGVWDEEIAKWADYPDKFVQAAYTGINVRVKTGKTRSSTKISPAVKPEYNHPWDAIILDEAHYIKGRSTSWTTAVQHLSKKSGALLALTGTPMPNWAYEIFTLLQVLYPDDAKPGQRFGSYHRWLKTWFLLEPNRFTTLPGTEIPQGLLACVGNPDCASRPPQDPCQHWADFTRVNLGSRFLRRLRSDVLQDLPPLTEQTIETPLSTAGRRMYRELKKEWLTQSEDGTEVVTWTLGSRNVLLDRITTSEWFANMEGEPRGGKLERLRNDLLSRSQPTLVLAHYRDTVEACVRVAESVGARTGYIHGGVNNAGDVVKQFKAGQLVVLVGSLETVAEGLTLTQADMVIFVEKSYKPSRNEQAMRRVHRIGQTRPVTVLDYVTPNTIDANKRKLLAKKTDQQMRVLTTAQITALL